MSQRRAAFVAATMLTLTAATKTIPAQSPTACLDAGILSYEEVSYETASRWFTRALAGKGADSLAGKQKSQALMYLGASQWLLDHSDSAGTVFKALLTHDPHMRPDSLVFPKRVTDAFYGIRKSVYGVARLTEIPNGLRVVVLSINPHILAVDVYGPDGKRLVNLFDGPSRDSVAVDWEEVGFKGRVVPAGRYEIVVSARDSSGKTLRVSRFPVTIPPP